MQARKQHSNKCIHPKCTFYIRTKFSSSIDGFKSISFISHSIFASVLLLWTRHAIPVCEFYPTCFLHRTLQYLNKLASFFSACFTISDCYIYSSIFEKGSRYGGTLKLNHYTSFKFKIKLVFQLATYLKYLFDWAKQQVSVYYVLSHSFDVIHFKQTENQLLHNITTF